MSRWTGKYIMSGGIKLAALGTAPIVLYGIFGPNDGNPIGLGLLAMVAIPVGALVVVVGAIKWLLERGR